MALLLWAPLLRGQAVEQRLEVKLVEVPVTVVDRSGRPVRDLEAANFRLYQDGEPVEITHFETVDIPRLSAAPDSPAIPPAARRAFLLLFDLGYSSPTSVERAKAAAKTFVETQLLEQDLCAVATYAVERGFQLLAGFGRDRTLLHLAIDGIGSPAFFRSRDPLGLIADPSERPATDPSGNPMREELRQHLEDIQREMNKGFDRLESSRVEKQVRDFGEVARALSSISGRKQVLLLSDGFHSDPSGTRLSVEAERTRGRAVESGEVWKVDTDSTFGSVAVLVRLQGMQDLFERSDVVLHAFDTRGLRVDVDPRHGHKIASNDSLFQLADRTGGQVFRNENDLSSSFSRMLTQQEVVYVLGFQPRASASSLRRFHRLEVKLTGVRGARANQPAGYYNRRDEGPLGERLAAADLMMDDRSQPGIAVALAAFPLPAEGERALVPVVLEVDGAALARMDGGTIDADLLLYAFDADAAAVDFRHQRVRFDLARLRESFARSFVRYVGAFKLPPGDFTVKALVRLNGDAAYGVSSAAVHVGGTSPSGLPLFLDLDSEPLILRESSESAEALARLLPVSQTAALSAHAIRPGAAKGIIVLSPGTDPSQISVQMRSRPGLQPVPVELETDDVPEERSLRTLSFTTGELEEGEYVLEWTIGGRDRAMIVHVAEASSVDGER